MIGCALAQVLQHLHYFKLNFHYYNPDFKSLWQKSFDQRTL
jgi:hypothetical protein